MKITRILLVEDEPNHVNLFRRGIKRIRPDIEVTVATNGQEGLDALRTMPHDGLLILLDINMPIMTGHEMLAEIYQIPEWRRLPVVVLTTSDERIDIERARAFDVTDYLIKPVTVDQLAPFLITRA